MILPLFGALIPRLITLPVGRSMSGILKAFQDFLVANGWAYVRAWITMITERGAALRVIDLGSDDVFAFAVKFMVINAAWCVLFSLPAAALAGFDYLGAPYLVSSLVMAVVFWVGMASVLHLSLRAFGGSANYRRTLVIFAMFTAFYPLIGVIYIPVDRFVAPLMAKQGFTEAALSEGMLSDLLAMAPLSDLIYAAVAYAIGLGILLWMHFLILRSALLVHGLHRGRAMGASVFYMIALFLFLSLVVGPINNLVLLAFA